MKYANASGAALPVDEWIPMGKDDIFDMASLTKLFTTILGMQQLERGVIALDGKVGSYLPGFNGEV